MERAALLQQFLPLSICKFRVSNFDFRFSIFGNLKAKQFV